ncbi:MAG: lysophospholipid acyltransferase family protein [Candidatus Tectomicrobia bacterium]|nr:lysophospholipid acyltransferase family protein [Candidatus Tectomicrobia bacterium]
MSPFLLQRFHRYIRFYLRRSFHAVRLSRAGPPPHLPDRSLVIFLNHPSWWDPLVCLFLADALFPDRRHYGPIDAEALARYRIFARMGFFGVIPGSRSSALAFLRVSQAILRQPQSALWITPEGAFTDPRQRPTRLQSGISHLARRLDRAFFVPLALEYPFWQERFPEALVRFGDGIPVEPGLSVEDYAALFSARLEATQDALARDARNQDRDRFEILLSGNAGIGGIYDAWRSLRARWRGEAFRKSHGADDS